MTIYFKDTFTDTPNTALSSHAPTIGSAYSTASNFNIAASGDVLSQAAQGFSVAAINAADVPPDWTYNFELTFIIENVVDSTGNFTHDLVIQRAPSPGATGTIARLVGGTSSSTWLLQLIHYLSSGGFGIGNGQVNISVIALGRYTARGTMEQTGFVSGHETFDFTLEFIRQSDGFYLKPDGTWQAGQIFAISGTYDDTVAVASFGEPFGAAPGAPPGISCFDFVGYVSYDDLIFQSPASLSIDPTTVIKSTTGNTLILTNPGASYTPGTPGTPTVTVDVGTITSQTVNSSTEIEVAYNAPGTAQTATLTAGSDTVTLEVTEPPTLVSGTASFTSADSSSVTLDCAAPTGAVGSVTYQWKRATRYDGTYSNLAGQTSLSLVDMTVTPGVEYWWKLVATDSLSRSVTSNSIVNAAWGPLPSIGTGSGDVILGFTGDSITAQVPGSGPTVDTCAAELNAAGYLATPSVVNRGIGGATASGWVAGSTALNNALAAFASAGVTHVHCMLGANDLRVGSDLTTWIADILSQANAVVASGRTFIIACPIYSTVGDAGRQNLFDAQPALRAICNGTTILFGDEWSFNRGQAALGDGVHPSDPAGGILIGDFWARGIARALQVGPATAYTFTGPSSGNLNSASTNFTITPNGDAAGITITPATDGFGVFTPTSVTFVASEAQTFTYTPTSGSGSPHTLSVSNDGGLTDPTSIDYTVIIPPATAYELAGPRRAALNRPVSIQILPNGLADGITFTPSLVGTGSFSPATVNGNGANGVTIQYTPTDLLDSPHTISIADNGGLTDPPPLIITIVIYDPYSYETSDLYRDITPMSF